MDNHHVVPWSLRRPDDARCSLCRRHHTFVHELGVRLTSDGAGGFQFFDRDGRDLPTAGKPLALDEASVEALCTQNRRDGIMIDSETSLPHWDGRPADYDHIVFCLTAALDGTRPRG